MKNIKEFSKNYFEEIRKAVDKLDSEKIQKEGYINN